MAFTEIGNEQVFNKLIEKGADISYHDIYGRNILHYVFYSSNPRENIISTRIACKICSIKPELILKQSRDMKTPWLLAAASGSISMLGMMSNYYPLRVLDSISNITAIHEASQYNKSLTIKYLVHNLHANINALTKEDQYTPLMMAALTSSYDSFLTLIHLGANTLIKNKHKNTVFSIILQRCSRLFIEESLSLVSSSFLSTNHEYLLWLSQNRISAQKYIEKNIFRLSDEDLNICDDKGLSLLMLCCTHGNSRVIDLLLKAGADPLYKHSTGTNILHVCARRNDVTLLGPILQQLLIFYPRAVRDDFLSQKDSNLNTPLHIAALNGNISIVCQLISYGIDFEQIGDNCNGLTPMNLAAVHSWKDTARLLAKVKNDNIDPFNRTSYKDQLQHFWRKNKKIYDKDVYQDMMNERYNNSTSRCSKSLMQQMKKIYTDIISKREQLLSTNTSQEDNFFEDIDEHIK